MVWSVRLPTWWRHNCESCFQKLQSRTPSYGHIRSSVLIGWLNNCLTLIISSLKLWSDWIKIKIWCWIFNQSETSIRAPDMSRGQWRSSTVNIPEYTTTWTRIYSRKMCYRTEYTVRVSPLGFFKGIANIISGPICLRTCPTCNITRDFSFLSRSFYSLIHLHTYYVTFLSHVTFSFSWLFCL